MGPNLIDHVEINPKIMVGKPVVKGTRIPVELILKMLSHDMSVKEILVEYPHLTKEDVQACLAYATQSLEVEEALPLERTGK